MKLLNKFFIPLMAAGVLASCSSDNLDGPDIIGGGIEGNGESVFMALNVELPTSNGTRSATEDDGTSDADPDFEVGSDAENKINSVLLVIAKQSNNALITAGTVSVDKLTAQADNTYKTVASFSKTALDSYYKSGDFSQDVNIFVFCNPTEALTTYVGTTTNIGKDGWINQVCNVDAAAGTNLGIWGAGTFLMNNAEIATRSLPKTMEDWDNYKSEANAFNLSGMNASGLANQVDNLNNRGPVKVERSVARFDFKDGSEEGNRTYDVIYGLNEDGAKGDCFIQVELQRMALTNMSKDFYYVPRVSADGTDTNWAYCGTENSTNYVVGPNWNAFLTKSTPESMLDFGKYFNYPFFTTNGIVDNTEVSGDKWNSYYISDVLDGENKDNYKGNEYKVWRYVTENVIPAPSENQTYDRSTIVVFKGRIKATEKAENADPAKFPGVSDIAKYLNNEGKILKGNVNDDPIIYQFNGSLYLTWENVRKAVWRESVSVENGNVVINRNNPLYVAVYGTGGMGTFTYKDGNEEKTATDSKELASGTADAAWTEWNTDRNDADKLKAMRKAVTSANITIYQSSTDTKLGAGYYCYYYYKNYHNNNNRPGVMGPMEFSVVRNNVYKLAVTSIKKLGHPRISENDPDSPDPGTPDESDDIYLTVTCKVVPWIVRINNIEF